MSDIVYELKNEDIRDHLEPLPPDEVIGYCGNSLDCLLVNVLEKKYPGTVATVNGAEWQLYHTDGGISPVTGILTFFQLDVLEAHDNYKEDEEPITKDEFMHLCWDYKRPVYQFLTGSEAPV